MAISEDTAALVAGQLTVAWAMRSGVPKPDPNNPTDSQVAAVYTRFRQAVSERDIKDVR